MDANTLVKEFEKAQDIINDYGAVLQTASTMAYGVPESSLPHAKKEIKKAIKLTVLILSKMEPSAKTTIQQLKSAYTLLANFVPDEDAKLLAKGQDAFNSGDPSQIASEDAQKALKRTVQISEESQALSREFEDYLGAISEK